MKPSLAGSMTMNSPTKSKYIMWPWRYSAGSASNGESTIALTTASKLSPAACYKAPAYYNNYITLETIYSGLSKSNFKDFHCDAAKEQCLGIIAEICVFWVCDEMLWVTGQTGRRQIDCSRVVGQQQRKSDRRQWSASILLSTSLCIWNTW